MNDELQEKMVELANKKEALKVQMSEVNVELQQTLLALGEGAYFQSKEGLVYKVVKPTGKYMYFDVIDYVRTKKQEESKGSLSKSEAKSLGFEVL